MARTEQVTVHDANARDLVDFLVRCTERLQSRRNGNPPPIVTVEQTFDLPVERLDGLMDTLREAVHAMDLSCVEYDCAQGDGTTSAIVQAVMNAQERPWARSRLIASIEEAGGRREAAGTAGVGGT